VASPTLDAGRIRCQAAAALRAALAVAALAPSAACELVEKPRTGVESPRASRVEVHGLVARRWDDDAARYVARAASGEIVRTERRMALVDVRLDAYEGNGAWAGGLSARTATTDLSGDRWALRGDVRLATPSGLAWTTGRADLVASSRRVSLPETSTVTGANFRASAPRVVAALGEDVVDVDGPVTATVTPRRADR
jgi:hypothetical protein